MTDSILETIKKMLGLEDAYYEAYDTDIIIFINDALMTLHQYGVGPKNGFAISGNSETWTAYLSENDGKILESVKTYIYLSVKLVFDPPTSSFVLKAYQNKCDRLEWRIKEQLESYPGEIPRENNTSNIDTASEIGGSLAVDTEDNIIGMSFLNSLRGDH